MTRNIHFYLVYNRTDISYTSDDSFVFVSVYRCFYVRARPWEYGCVLGNIIYLFLLQIYSDVCPFRSNTWVITIYEDVCLSY